MDTLAFTTGKGGTAYELPRYRVTKGGIEPTGEATRIEFVRGSGSAADPVTSADGILVETLLNVIIRDLEHKHARVPAEEGERTLNHLRSALDALNARTYRRQMRGLLGTYQSERSG